MHESAHHRRLLGQRLIVAALAALVGHLAWPLSSLLLERSSYFASSLRECTLFPRDPLHVAGAIAGWVGVCVLLPRWSFTGSAWLAVSVGYLWGVASIALYGVLTCLLLPHAGSTWGEAIARAFAVGLWAPVLAATACVPIGIVSALVIRKTNAKNCDDPVRPPAGSPVARCHPGGRGPG